MGRRDLKWLMREGSFFLEVDRLLEGKSEDYIAGFHAGVDLAFDYVCDALDDVQDLIRRLEEATGPPNDQLQQRESI